jgi:hypothetical protein
MKERIIDGQLGRFVGFQRACFSQGGQTCGGYTGVRPFYNTRLGKESVTKLVRVGNQKCMEYNSSSHSTLLIET